MTNNLSLNWNSENTNVALSEFPMFSENVKHSHSTDFLEYMLMVRPPLEQTSDKLELYIWENWERGYSVSSSTNNLYLEIYPLKNKLEDSLELSGDFSASVFVYSNLIHSNINWYVGIVKSEDFSLSF